MEQKITIDGYTNLGTTYPSPSHAKMMQESLQAMADERNGGDIGRKYVYSSKGDYTVVTCPSIKAYYTEDFR